MKPDKSITHLSIYKIDKFEVFETVDSYDKMNQAIFSFGEDENKPLTYEKRVGEAFEIYTQFFCNRYGETPLLGIFEVTDTSDDAFTRGYDFLFKSIGGRLGQLQSKCRKNPVYSFNSGELSTMGDVARSYNIDNDKSILFINFDDHDKLFDYKYKNARVGRRICDRKMQEAYILRDPEFWNDFRKTIKESAKVVFKTPPVLRDVQNWILHGHTFEDVNYPGTEVVINGTIDKARIQASCSTGKTLCIYHNIMDAFGIGKNLVFVIEPSLALIDQTFESFYRWKMFSDENALNKSDVSCLIIRSGPQPRFNPLIVDFEQTLTPDTAINFIKSRLLDKRKIVVFVTMASQELKYEGIVAKLAETSVRINLEIVDEYHNIITNDAELPKQIAIVNYLSNNKSRTDGTLFYSASHKDGRVLSTFDENLFGPLVAKVTRKHLRDRAYVVPGMRVRFIKVQPGSPGFELRRDAAVQGLNIDKAQVEAVGIIIAHRDSLRFYSEPNLVTFGDHVEGCRHISADQLMSIHMSGVIQHFVAAETLSPDRARTFNIVRSGGNNVIHQHSIMREGINIDNLHGEIINRGMGTHSLQQSIGRGDRTLAEDTVKFQRGEMKLDSPIGWKKYNNLVYIILDSDDETNSDRVKEVVRYMESESGIPREEWDIAVTKEHRGGTEKPIIDPIVDRPLIDIRFNDDVLNMMIKKAEIEIKTEMQRIEEDDLDEVVKSRTFVQDVERVRNILNQK